MFGKILRSVVAIALLALAVISYTPAVNDASLLSKTGDSTVRMAVEHDTTGR